ncbi:hypothetical protein Ga0074812_102463 [Parafrankia irregularis]|uniref:Uncharacterized protein n=1 Tax=Parafrankia irregularis TaxID=795642 RepID=A0A0S4QFX7_9ACTN|nr:MULTISPECIES: hypothetical protein [Parafrankia]MBE3202919.1 hypothetical protein [Parafrankia sp. CH37]CUU54453.1 hypothetical protein Ga0074812_102463 [Parafrankia irregularis]
MTHDRQLTLDDQQTWRDLSAALADSWQGRTVLAQLRDDRAAGTESLRAMLAEGPPPGLSRLVELYGVDRLVACAHGQARTRLPRRTVIAGCVFVALVVAAVVTAVSVRGSGGESPPPVSPTAREAAALTGPATLGPSSTFPERTGPLSGDLQDKELQAALVRRLAGAQWVRFTEEGFAYEARAVMVHNLTDGTESTRPGFHKLAFLIEVHNLQQDRSVPIPIAGDYFGSFIAVPKSLATGADGDCAHPFTDRFHTSAAELVNGTADKCDMTLRPLTHKDRYEFTDLSFVADQNVTFGMVAESDVSDLVPDTAVSLVVDSDTTAGSTDASSVLVPLGFG